ncbi:MAG: c-type cytochrome [Proteobacteria bacterium]|nr:c-type cytochrome [Pseudomonadota bacterium]NIS71084.1 c-type cytochrome [Pseudomonadota bacterium]
MHRKAKGTVIFGLFWVSSFFLVGSLAWCDTYVSGKVLTSDGKVVASGAVALEKGELHNNAFLAGGKILPDGTFKIPLPSGGPWGLHVYSEGYIYFPLQIRVNEGMDNETPVILPLDSNPDDDPRISNIRFAKASDQVFRITMRVDDSDGNLGPQMLAVDTKRFRAYRMLPVGGDLDDKKANFPVGDYVSPFIPAALDKEDPRDWLFVVADHQCSNGPIYDGLYQSVFRQPMAHTESLRCEVLGIWKSNFDKVYRFYLLSPGKLKGEQFDGNLIIDRMVQEQDRITMDFRFEGKKGEGTLRLVCEDSRVILTGDFTLPGRSGEWIFTKLKNEEIFPKGQDLFMANCAVCHFHDSTETKVGPGLKGVFKNPQLPGTGRPTSEETVRKQIQQGGGKMPPFKNLKEEEISEIIDYLKTL